MLGVVAGRPRSAMSPRSRSSIGKRSRRSRCSTCGRRSNGRARRHSGRSASTRSRFARATPIASWAAIWCARRDGHVETVPQRREGKGAASRDPVRQAPHHAPSRRGARQGAQGRIRRLDGKDRCFIKGQKYKLLSRRENLTLEGKRSLELLLAANKRLNTAYALKESFGQQWDYQRESWARRFFDNWRASLKWQRLKPYQRFADMIDRHWDGIAAYCKPENKVSLGFVEGLNNKIRVFQRRAYGLKDEEYLRLKVLSCMLPPL